MRIREPEDEIIQFDYMDNDTGVLIQMAKEYIDNIYLKNIVLLIIKTILTDL